MSSLRVKETWVQLSAFGLSLRRIPEGEIALPEVVEREKNRIVFRCGTDDLIGVIALYEHYMIYENLFFVFDPSDQVQELAAEFFPEDSYKFRVDIHRFGRALLYLNKEVMYMWALLPTSPDGQAAAGRLRGFDDMRWSESGASG